MASKTIATFKVEYWQYLNPQGEPTAPLPPFATEEKLIALYKDMLLARHFDTKAIALQRTGQLGTYPSMLGQEAIGTAIGDVMTPEDILVPYYRDYASLLKRGVTLAEAFTFWSGDERGNDFETPKEDFPVAIPVATQCLHAAGVAYAIKLRKQKRVVVTTIGDGGTSKGDFYEAMNFAGVHHLPVVFVVNNNQWAISVSRKEQTAALSIAQKAIATGFSGVQVDGNDIIALHHVIQNACDKAREGQGPTLIEALTYRLTDHTTADDATRYCDQKILEEAWQREPLKRLKNFLGNTCQFDDHIDEQLKKQCEHEIEKGIEQWQALAPEKAQAMFDHLYNTLPEKYKNQYDNLDKDNE